MNEIPSLFKKLVKDIVTRISALENKSEQLLQMITSVSLMKGEKGDKGDSVCGEKGDKGEKGNKGDRGDKGDRGEAGLMGRQGLPGIAGRAGIDGKDGKNGKDGKRGEKGDKGDKGDDGKSAYEIWLEEGNYGSKQTFLEELKSKNKSSNYVSVSAPNPQLYIPYTGATSNVDLGTNTITASGFIGNASTATTLQTARNIGGVSFNGSANIVPQTIESADESSDTTCFPLFITASGTQQLQPKNNTALTFNSSTGVLGATSFVGNTAASTITGTTLASNVVTSSLTSVGTLTGLNINSANNNLIQTNLSGGSAKYSAIQLGRTAVEGTFAIPGSGSQWSNSAVVGDVVIRTEDSTKTVRILAGSGTSMLDVTNANVSVAGATAYMGLNVSGNIALGKYDRSVGSDYVGLVGSSNNFSSNTGESGIEIQTTSGGQKLHFLTHLGFVSSGRRMTINEDGTVSIGATGVDTNYLFQLPNSATQKAKANAWDTYSDARLKENVTQINSALDIICALKGYRYTWKESAVTPVLEDKDGNPRQPTQAEQSQINRDKVKINAGGIAQEWVEHVPEIVTLDTEGVATAINYGGLVPFLVEAIKELKQRVAELEVAS